MSPEQMLSAKDVDARTDVWALGVILYELVTGKAVWQADTMQGLCALIASSPAPSLLVEAPDASPILADVIAHCLVKSRDERIASVADLAIALEPIAPDSARTSIERIVRVARKERAVGTGPRSTPSGTPSKIPSRGGASRPAATAAVAADATTGGDARRGPPARVGVILAITVAALLVAGIAVNAMLARRPPAPPADIGLANGGPAVGPAIGTAVVAVASTSTPAAPAASSAEPVSMVAASPAIPATASARRVRPPVGPAPTGRTTAAAAQASPDPPTSLPATAASATPVTPAHTNRALSDRK
jgi:serine/threonine-protein kinase